MTKIVVLLNLKAGKSAADYEQWARNTDLPTVNGLASVSGFQVFQTIGVLGSDAKAPYDYIEIIDVADMDQFGVDTSTDKMAAIAAEFQSWADPIFILTRNIEDPA